LVFLANLTPALYSTPESATGFKTEGLVSQRMPIQDTLDEIVSRIVKRFHPERIILFGSHARGSTHTDSDVDLLIVMPVPDTRRRLTTQIDLALVGIDIPTDVIVVTPEEVQRNKDRIGTIIRPALREGKVLYERAA
jgi:predicted nucleotidyltransferase